MNWQRWLVVLSVTVVIAALLVLGFMPQPVQVETVTVIRGSLEVTVEEEGKTRVRDRFVVSSPVLGFSRRIGLKVGDPVVRGQTLAEIEPLRADILDARRRAAAEARVAGAAAGVRHSEEQLRVAEADAALAEKEFARLKSAHASGTVSIELLERAEATKRSAAARQRSARFSIEVAQFELEAARTELRYSTDDETVESLPPVAVRSPVEGRVLKVWRESEGVVNRGSALVEVGDPRALEVEVDVLSADAVQISAGTPVVLERWGGTPLDARVRHVEPVGFTKISALGVEEQRVLAIVDFASPMDEWERIGDGYRVEAKFILWRGDDVLQVPTSTLFRRGDAWAVFVVHDGAARFRPIEIGHRSGLRAEVNGGLSAGEIVVTHPNDTIEDGTKVASNEKD